jgi:hypothetical protein
MHWMLEAIELAPSQGGAWWAVRQLVAQGAGPFPLTLIEADGAA